MKDKPLCLYPDCDDPAKLRGLCTAHYMSAAQQVHRGLTTWRKLQNAGKVGAPGKRGRKSTSGAYFKA